MRDFPVSMRKQSRGCVFCVARGDVDRPVRALYSMVPCGPKSESFLACLGTACAPAFPIREIKLMEMEYLDTVMEDEANQARLGRQIAQLDRPASADDESGIDARRNQKGIRVTCILLVLCLWSLF